MNLTDVRQAIADQLGSIDGVRVYATQPDQLAVPAGGAIVVQPAAAYVDYVQAMSGGLSELRYTLLVVAARTSERSAQARLDELLSAGLGETRSVYDALKPNDDPQTLGGVVQDVGLMTASAPTALEAGEVTYLAAEIDIRVLVRRLHT
jgi:hypothetical protein